MAEPDLLELFRKHAQDGQKEMVSLYCNDVRRLSRTKKIKRLLVLGRYAGNSELCGHVLRVLEMLPELPGMACPAYRGVLVLLFLSRDRDVLCRLRENVVLPCRKRGRTEEMLWLCEILYAIGPSVSLYDIYREVCLYFYLERRKQLRGYSTCVSELDFQFAERRLRILSVAVFRLKVIFYSPGVYSVGTLSLLCRMSYSAFRNRFLSVYGLPPGRWLRNRRIKRICLDIKYNHGLSLGEISERNGFSSASRLCEFCKRNMGCTPGRLKQALAHRWRSK